MEDHGSVLSRIANLIYFIRITVASTLRIGLQGNKNDNSEEVKKSQEALKAKSDLLIEDM